MTHAPTNEVIEATASRPRSKPLPPEYLAVIRRVAGYGVHRAVV